MVNHRYCIAVRLPERSFPYNAGRSCSLLVCFCCAAAAACSAAVQWRCVHVVSDAWLRDSVELGYPVTESNYKVPPVLEAK